MGRLSLVWHLIDTCLEAGILWILWVEFNYDKIQDEKREYREAQKKRKKSKDLVPTPLPSSGDKKDVALEPGAKIGFKEGASKTPLLGLCVVCERVHENPIHFQERKDQDAYGGGGRPYCPNRQATKDL